MAVDVLSGNKEEDVDFKNQNMFASGGNLHVCC